MRANIETRCGVRGFLTDRVSIGDCCAKEILVFPSRGWKKKGICYLPFDVSESTSFTHVSPHRKDSGARRRQRPEPRRAKLVPGRDDGAQSIKVPPGACLFYSLTPDWMEM